MLFKQKSSVPLPTPTCEATDVNCRKLQKALFTFLSAQGSNLFGPAVSLWSGSLQLELISSSQSSPGFIFIERMPRIRLSIGSLPWGLKGFIGTHTTSNRPNLNPNIEQTAPSVKNGEIHEKTPIVQKKATTKRRVQVENTSKIVL